MWNGRALFDRAPAISHLVYVEFIVCVCMRYTYTHRSYRNSVLWRNIRYGNENVRHTQHTENIYPALLKAFPAKIFLLCCATVCVRARFVLSAMFSIAWLAFFATKIDCQLNRDAFGHRQPMRLTNIIQQTHGNWRALFSVLRIH